MVAIIAVALLLNKGDKSKKKTNLDWPTSGLAQKIPDSKFPYGEVNRLSEEELSIDVYDVVLKYDMIYLNKSAFTEESMVLKTSV